MVYVYILRSKSDGKWYIGSTENITKKVSEYNKPVFEESEDKGALELMYCEACSTQQEAETKLRHLNLLWLNVK